MWRVVSVSLITFAQAPPSLHAAMDGWIAQHLSRLAN